MTAPDLQIQAVSPPGPSVGFGLAGDSQLTRSGSGAGGWQIVDRPRRGATTEWVDYGPYTLTVSLILDGYGAPGGPVSVDAAVAMVETWELPPAGTTPPQPPVLKVTGPVPHNDLQWVVQTLTWKEAIRDPASQVRWQQNLDLVLLEYRPPQITTQAAVPSTATPAAAARANAASAGSTYTVKSGDTLQTIANAIYGSYGYWTLLANANALRSPTAVTVGQVLTVPAKTLVPPPLSPVNGTNYRILTGS